MTTAVCKAANILGMREELLNELLVLINMTSGARPHAASAAVIACGAQRA